MQYREVRLTERQLYHGAGAVRRRIRQLEKQLDRSSYDGKPGMKDKVITELSELYLLAEILEHNHRAIGRRFAERLRARTAPDYRPDDYRPPEVEQAHQNAIQSLVPR